MFQQDYEKEDALVVASFGTRARSSDDGIIICEVAGMRCEFLIDSGAQVNTFTEGMFQKLMNNVKYKENVYNLHDGPDFPLRAYATIGNIPVSATFEAYLFVSEDRPMLLEKFYVVNELRSLLGRATANRYSVLMLGLKVPIDSDRLTDKLNAYPSNIASLVKKEPFPKFNVPPVKISYNRNEPPCMNIFMNIPRAVKPLVEQRLQQLVESEIIEYVTDDMDMSFCSSMLVVPKGKDDIRLVIDLRGPNQYIYRTPFAMPTLEKILAELNGSTWFSTIDLSNAYFHVELDKDSRHLTNFFTEFGVYRFVKIRFRLHEGLNLFQK